MKLGSHLVAGLSIVRRSYEQFDDTIYFSFSVMHIHSTKFEVPCICATRYIQLGPHFVTSL